MRAKYYYRILRQMQLKKAFAILFITVAIFISIYYYFINQISPTIKTLCDTRANAIALKSTNEVVMEKIKNIEYSNLIDTTINESGNITGLKANVIEMNKLSAEIATDIQKRLLEIESEEIQIPIGKILGLSIFSGYGPKITIKTIPVGNVFVDFKTEFKSEGINQTRHRIYLEIKTSVKIVAPFMSDVVPFETNMTVSETVIVGDIPNSYYNLNGLEAVDTTNFMN